MSLIPITKTFGIVDALQTLAPNSEWVLTGDDISGLEWKNESIQRPTDEEIFAEIERLQSEHDALEYQRLRLREYPNMADYLDGVVKGDQAQIDAYIAACQEIKAKYPKPGSQVDMSGLDNSNVAGESLI